MNDLFRAIFGFPTIDQQGNRINDRPPDNFKNNFSEGDGHDENDEDNEGNMNMGAQGGIFGFPLFDDSIEIHQRFQRLVNEMNKAFGIFSFSSGPSISWDDGNSSMSTVFNEGSVPQQESLRDAYLKKPDCICNQNHQREEFNLNLGHNLDPGTSTNLNSEVAVSYPKMFSKSIFIQTVRKPDGTVETIKKVRDSTGNEKTTITQSNEDNPVPPQEVVDLMPKEDTSGISIFRKFFPF